MSGLAIYEARWMERVRTLTLWSLVFLVAASASVLLAANPAHAKTFTVDTTGDFPDFNPGDDACLVSIFAGCSLRAAIEQANITDGADTIKFNIDTNSSGCDSTTKVCTISPTEALPTITEQVTINGYTQRPCSINPAPCSSPNTLTIGTNAKLLIELDGSQAGDFVDGLTIRGAPNTVVTGLVINNFSDGSGVFIIFSTFALQTTDVVIKGNFLGTDPSGTRAEGNADGVQIFGGASTRRNTIGGTSDKDVNLISGNRFNGVFLRAPGNKIQGNLIGTTRDGTSALGGGPATGVDINPGASNNLIGDNDPSDDPASGPPNAANVIAFNQRGGVSVTRNPDSPTVGSRILGNSIFENAGLGIDLNADGVTPNDRKDSDNGPNHLQNFPELTSAKNVADGTSSVIGELNSRANETFTIQFFRSPGADPSGFGEGTEYIGQKSVTTDARGNASFTFKPAKRLALGEFITATATNKATGDTSEFSIARKVRLD